MGWHLRAWLGDIRDGDTCSAYTLHELYRYDLGTRYYELCELVCMGLRWGVMTLLGCGISHRFRFKCWSGDFEDGARSHKKLVGLSYEYVNTNWIHSFIPSLRLYTANEKCT